MTLMVDNRLPVVYNTQYGYNIYVGVMIMTNKMKCSACLATVPESRECSACGHA